MKSKNSISTAEYNLAVAKTKANNPRARMFALGRLRDGDMNKTEERFSRVLAAQQAAGEVLWWKFEAIKLKLAPNTHLTVDFFVMKADGELQAIDVKGFVMDDSIAKLKMAADLFPFRFFIAKERAAREGGGFAIQQIGGD